MRDLVQRIDSLTHQLERLGESDMGRLEQKHARQFHDATRILRTLVAQLKAQLNKEPRR